MQLATALTKKEIETLGNFVPPREHKTLSEFQGVIIRLDDAILAGGWKKQEGLFNRDRVPNLAVATYDSVRCTVDITDGELIFNSDMQTYRSHGALPVKDNSVTYRTGMPPIPNHVRALAKQNESYTGEKPAVLFEADKWERMQEVPRRALEDPALLKHIVGNLWGVLTTWDLTKAEKAVLQKYLG